MIRLAAAAAASALLLGACGRDAEVEAAADAPAAAVATAPATPPPSAPAAGPPAEPARDVQLALDSEGLRLVARPSGSTRLLAFETPEAQVLAALRPIRGAPSERAGSDECGAGPLAFVSWPDELQLVFQDGRFVGWSTDERGPSTMSGVAVGSTRADLEAAYAAQVEQSTLGTEFAAGGLFGLLSGPGRDARVTTLWAGTICAFR